MHPGPVEAGQSQKHEGHCQRGVPERGVSREAGEQRRPAGTAQLAKSSPLAIHGAAHRSRKACCHARPMGGASDARSRPRGGRSTAMDTARVPPSRATPSSLSPSLRRQQPKRPGGRLKRLLEAPPPAELVLWMECRHPRPREPAGLAAGQEIGALHPLRHRSSHVHGTGHEPRRGREAQPDEPRYASFRQPLGGPVVTRFNLSRSPTRGARGSAEVTLAIWQAMDFWEIVPGIQKSGGPHQPSVRLSHVVLELLGRLGRGLAPHLEVGQALRAVLREQTEQTE